MAIEIVEKLRSPEGCKWDREQTYDSLRKNMLEEAYEAVEAVNRNDLENFKEELGDVLLQVLLNCQIAKDNKAFCLDDVAAILCEKLIRRHPHVFSDVVVEDTNEILKNWEKIKKQEKNAQQKLSIMNDLKNLQSTCSLIQAMKISKKAVSVGFEWKNRDDILKCVKSEIKEFVNAKTLEEKEEELGDLFFSVVNLARFEKIDPECALLKANLKFVKRFQKMEEISSKPLENCSYEEFEALWEEAKKLSQTQVQS